MPHVEINFLAVLVCGVVSMIIGATWYGPLFGKKWMKEEGSTEEELRKDFNENFKLLEEKIQLYKIGWQFTHEGKNYQRILFFDIETGVFSLKEKR